MRRVLVSLGLLAFAACDAEAGVDPAAADHGPLGKADGALEPLVDGTPGAVGVLRLLASAETTFGVLDVDARLDRRAAQNLIAARNGPNGVYEGGGRGTDDALFETIDEVDAVSWVGPVALDRLHAFALQQDFVPGGDDVLGEWDGVEFTVDEAARALSFVNAASEEELDDVLRDVRPVRSITEARPLASVLQLSGLYFVGPVMMQRIVDASAADGADELCSEADPCSAGLVCMGRVDGVGLCRDLSNVPGQGEECDVAEDCAADLVCTGLTIFETGTCNPDWMGGTYSNTTVADIPGIVMPAAIGLPQTIRGQASVPEDIVVTVHLEHTDPSSLQFTLEDPNGVQDLIWDGPAMDGAPFPNELLSFAISRDDNVNGHWTLHVQNVQGRGEGSVQGWDLYLTSRFD